MILGYYIRFVSLDSKKKCLFPMLFVSESKTAIISVHTVCDQQNWKFLFIKCFRLKAYHIIERDFYVVHIWTIYITHKKAMKKQATVCSKILNVNQKKKLFHQIKLKIKIKGYLLIWCTAVSWIKINLILFLLINFI